MDQRVQRRWSGTVEECEARQAPASLVPAPATPPPTTTSPTLVGPVYTAAVPYAPTRPW